MRTFFRHPTIIKICIYFTFKRFYFSSSIFFVLYWFTIKSFFNPFIKKDIHLALSRFLAHGLIAPCFQKLISFQFFSLSIFVNCYFFDLAFQFLVSVFLFCIKCIKFMFDVAVRSFISIGGRRRA